MTRDLGDDVRRRAEAVEAEPLAVAREPQRAVADQPRAQQGRRLLVGVALGDREAEALVGDGVLGVAAVEVVAGEPGRVAEVLAAAAAVAARSVRPAEPRDAEPPPVLRLGDDLVAGHERQLRTRQLAVDDVQVRTAYAAGTHAQHHLTGSGLRDRKLA